MNKNNTFFDYQQVIMLLDDITNYVEAYLNYINSTKKDKIDIDEINDYISCVPEITEYIKDYIEHTFIFICKYEEENH